MASNNTIRFSGMASGMDTEALVKAMVTRYQEKVDDKKKSQTLLEWKKDIYKEVSLKVNTFYTDIARKLRLDSSFSTKALKSSDSSKVDVKSTGTATEGKHTIDYVKQVGESAVINTSTIGKVITGKINTDSNDIANPYTKLESLGIKDDLTIRVSDGINSKDITLSASDTMDKVVSKINKLNDGSSSGINIAASFNILEGKFNITSGMMGQNAQNISIKAVDSSRSDELNTLGLATSKITKETKLSELGINSKHTLKVSDGTDSSDVIIDKDMTIGELAAEISQELAHGTATFDETAGAFFISSKGTGSSQMINLEVTEGSLGNTLLDKLGIGNSISIADDSLNIWEQSYQFDMIEGSTATSTLKDAFGVSDELRIEINGSPVTLQATATVRDLVNKITEKTGSLHGEPIIEGSKLNICLYRMNEVRPGEFEMPDEEEIKINNTEPSSVTSQKTINLSGNLGNVNESTKLGTQNGDKLKINTGTGDVFFDLSATSTVGDVISKIKESLPSLSDDDITLSSNGQIKIKGLTSDITIEIEKNVSNHSAKGKNAIFSYNGIEMQSESNTVSVNGMELTINSKTNDPVYINVTNDTEAAFKFITEFVNSYNELIKYGNEKVHADSYGKLEPLTSEEKEAMSDKDVEAWEKKIKDGLLRNDSTLSELLSEMRTILSSVVEDGDFKSLASIGITTSSTLADRGKLILDEEKLKKALAENPDDVTSLFTGSGRSAKRAYLQANKDKTAADYEALDDKEKDKWKAKVKGIGEKMYDLLNSKFTYVANTKTSSSLFSDTVLDKDIKSTKSEYERLVDILNAKEDYYYKLFANMETTMNKLNNQQNYISQMFAAK